MELLDRPPPASDTILLDGVPILGNLFGQGSPDLCWISGDQGGDGHVAIYAATIPPSSVDFAGSVTIEGATTKLLPDGAVALGEGISIVVVYETLGSPARNVDLFRGFTGTESSNVVNAADAILQFSNTYDHDHQDIHLFLIALDGQGDAQFLDMDRFMINGVDRGGQVAGTTAEAYNAWAGLLGPNGLGHHHLYDSVDDGIQGFLAGGGSSDQIWVQSEKVGAWKDCIGHSFAGVSFPVAIDVCGDGTIGGTEECDFANLNNQSCQSLGYTGGTLLCREDCMFDASGCEGYVPTCGDGYVEGTEDCDGSDLNGGTCESLSFSGGTLACALDCTFDTSSCDEYIPVCGNAIVDDGECCDGGLGSQTCASLGFESGTLTCSADCTYDVADCILPASIDPDLILVQGEAPKPVQIRVACGSPYKLLYDGSYIQVWDSPTRTNAIPSDTVFNAPALVADVEPDCDVDLRDYAAFQTCFTGTPNLNPPLPASCTMFDFDSDVDVDLDDFNVLHPYFGNPMYGTTPVTVYVEGLITSTALGDVVLMITGDRDGDGIFEDVQARPVTTMSVTTGPLTGRFGDAVTLTTAPAIAPLIFDCNATAQWAGVFSPTIGTDSLPFTVDFSPKQVRESASNSADLIVGDGSSPDFPDMTGVSYPGSFSGTVTLRLHGIEAVKSIDWTPDPSPFRFEEITYDGDSLHRGPPILNGERTTMPVVALSRMPNPNVPEAHLLNAYSYHSAIVLDIAPNPIPVRDTPEFVDVSLVSFDDTGIEVDRRDGIRLYRQLPKTTFEWDVSLNPPDATGIPDCDTRTVPMGGSIVDVDVGVQVSHSFPHDLRITIDHGGEQVFLWEAQCLIGGITALDVLFDDEVSEPSFCSELVFGASVQPVELDPGYPLPGNGLADIDFKGVQGDWTICVSDHQANDTGTLTHWSLELTSNQPAASAYQYLQRLDTPIVLVDTAVDQNNYPKLLILQVPIDGTLTIVP